MQPMVCPEWNGKLEPILDILRDLPFWGYGQGEHSSNAKHIRGSVFFEPRTANGTNLSICPLVIEG